LKRVRGLIGAYIENQRDRVEMLESYAEAAERVIS
jgi:hypothetical protein